MTINDDKTVLATREVPVWDLGVRLFHWALVILVITSFITVKIGGNAMTYHVWSGYAILTLLIFRIVWGVVGGTHARFASFIRGEIVKWGRVAKEADIKIDQ